MASYTTSLRLVQPSTGEFPGSWGSEINTSLTAVVDKAVAGAATITMTAANYTLTNANGAADEAKSMFLVLGGTPGASYQVICPAVSKLYFVTNSTGFAQTVKTSAGSGISVPNGASMTLRCNGTDVVVAQNYFGSLTLGAALPIASGGTGSTSTTYCSLTANVTGTLPVGNGGSGATTLTGVLKGNGASAFSAAVAGTDYVTPTGSETLTNKRFTPRLNIQTTTASPWAWNSDSFDQQGFTALANALTINADAGTPTDGQRTILRFKDNGTGRALTWTTGASNSFRAIGVTLPTTTVANKTTYVGCVYNSADSRWDAVAVTTEA